MSELKAPRRGFGRRGWCLFAVGFIAGGFTTYWFSPQRAARLQAASRAEALLDANRDNDAVAQAPEVVSMQEVLQLAEEALQIWQQEVDDYTATLIKQESVGGSVGEPNELLIKVHCRHRAADRQETEPMRVYLRFDQPDSVAGREVIWCEDLHDGKLVAHEAGLLGLMTVRLDPNGMVAMRGQRYPIHQIGLTNLIKQLIERGQTDRDNPDVQVTIRRGLSGEATPGSPAAIDLIEVTRQQPSGRADDFSLARIYFDSERKIPFQYEAYGWPEDSEQAKIALDNRDSSQLPLLESYTYLNLQTNVGLTEQDFDPANPQYKYR